MNKLSEIIKNITFCVEEANYAKVGNFWKDIVYFWKQHRLYYVDSGSSKMNLRSTCIELKAGYLYYIPQNSVVTASDTNELSHYFIHFRLNEVGNTLLNTFPVNTKGIPINDDEIRIFKKVISVINNEPKTPAGELLVNGCMQALLSRFMTELNDKSHDKNILRFYDIIQYIQNNTEKRISVTELASMANLNKVYFSNCFSKIVGQPPLQYIIDKKLQKAMHLMKDDGLTIKEIAYKLNFSDELYFSRLFKKKNGLSPSEFRQILKSN